MDDIIEEGFKSSVIDWAKREAECDREYWRDRFIRGEGLIKQIAIFVLQNGGGKGK